MQEITKALVRFQSLVKNPQKNSKNPHFRSNYINLDGLLEAVKPELTECGLFLTQTFEMANGVTGLRTRLLHTSGDSVDSFIPISPDKANIQGLGSAITYLRRYSLESICGICGTDDDDGERAVGRGENKKVPEHGPLNNNSPSEGMKKKLWALLYKKYKDGNIPKEQADFVNKCTGDQCSKAIDKLEAELGK